MNIFVLDENPVQAARDLCDKHVVKMTMESAQILSTVLAKLGTDGPLKSTHANHPCVIWAGENYSNYMWLLSHFTAQLEEYTRRYKKVHAYAAHVELFAARRHSLMSGERTPFAQAMPEQYRQEDAVAAYRAYYLGDKAYFAKWQHSKRPSWWPAC